MQEPAIQNALVAAQETSLTSWQADLRTLFDATRDRFPDVVWELNNGDGGETELFYGHKALVYARAPAIFHSRYIAGRTSPTRPPFPYLHSPLRKLPPSTATLDLQAGPDADRAKSPDGEEEEEATADAPRTAGPAVLRLKSAMVTSLFSAELEYLYTAQGVGPAFECLFDSPERLHGNDVEDRRMLKLREDLVYMWRARLYADVRLAVTVADPDSSATSTAVFYSHRFILASRSPYFRSRLLSNHATTSPDEPLTITLPSEHFTPASLHFTLGYIYTGTLLFSPRSFDLETTFAIIRSAKYLGMATLISEAEAFIVQEMLHGLFHAYLPFEEYDRTTQGEWGVGGCRCRQCQRRVVRVLKFALAESFQNKVLERGARRALVAHFGESWATPEFAALPPKTRAGLLKGLLNRTTTQSAVPILFASNDALVKLDALKDPWANTVRDMILEARKNADQVLCANIVECLGRGDFLNLLDDDVEPEALKKVKWVMDSATRGLDPINAGMVYQALVSSVLLRPHLGNTLLSPTSPLRTLVEEARKDIIAWLRKHWTNVRLSSGFDALEGYALKEIGQELEVAVQDLVRNATYGTPRIGSRRPLDFRSIKPSSSKSELQKGSPILPLRQPPGLRHAGSLDPKAQATESESSPRRLRPARVLRPEGPGTSEVGSPRRTPVSPRGEHADIPQSPNITSRKRSDTAPIPRRDTPNRPRSAVASQSSPVVGRTDPEVVDSPRVRATPIQRTPSRRLSKDHVASESAKEKRLRRVGVVSPLPPTPEPTPQRRRRSVIMRESRRHGEEAATAPPKEPTPRRPPRRSPSSDRRSSVDLLTRLASASGAVAKQQRMQRPPKPKRGITLNVGIPCIISSRQTRFRAYARYMGELDGEKGQWVGVEVPMADGQAIDKSKPGRWNDGTWRGVRYFEVGAGTNWDSKPKRPPPPPRGRVHDLRGNETKPQQKAERETTPRMRGLFVRPSQVLYVLDSG